MKMDPEELYNLVFKVNEFFYELIFNDPWLKNIFAVVEQKIITLQQTDFMVGSLGGPKKYSGRNPKDAHVHIFVDEEMWQLREKYLKEAFEKASVPLEIREKWIAIDEAFKAVILKKDISECQKRYVTDTIIYYPFKKSA